MPTGYTHKIANGEITTLREFALIAARGMGALVMMRDEPFDAPIPERFEPSDYHVKAIDKARQDLAAVSALSIDACALHAAKDYQERKAAHETYVARKRVTKARYEAMLTEVQAWTTSPEGLREFMLDQLRQSIEFDCSEKYDQVPKVGSGEQWRDRVIARAGHEITYHTAERDAEIERTQARNAWIAQLRRSLDDYEAGIR